MTKLCANCVCVCEKGPGGADDRRMADEAVGRRTGVHNRKTRTSHKDVGKKC